MQFDTKVNVFGTFLGTTDSRGKLVIYKLDGNKKPEPYQTIKAYKRSDVSHDGPSWRLDWSDYKFGNFIATCGLDKKVESLLTF